MSPVSIMYSLRSYNAGEVGEGVLRESRCSCLGKGRCGAGRSAPVTNPCASSTGTGGRPALGRAAVGRHWRPAAGPVARNSVSHKIQIRRRIKSH